MPSITPSQFKELLLRFSRILWREIRINAYGQTFPLKPTTLNLLVNDICNSRCQMCMIWQKKKDKEISPLELKEILSDSLFSNLKYVGISGGEPTLREDLPQFYKALTQKKPLLKGLGIITNAINHDQVIQLILDSAKVCEESHIPFNVMVSLDGVGDVHDNIRGRDGNFNSAVEVIQYFRDKTDIPVSIGCTITKENVWYVDELLDWCISEEVYARFRVAEFINRLYNDTQTEYIRNFSHVEKYHLGLFFAKLEARYERSDQIKRTYRNIRSMLLDGAPRSISCPYQSHAVTLDCRGQLLYCAPKSPILGSALQSSANDIYKTNINIRKQILVSDCCGCIHDYHTDEDLQEFRAFILKKIWRYRLSLKSAMNATKDLITPIQSKKTIREDKKILIVGWFGTETAGDKAVLAEALRELSLSHEQTEISIASINPYLTRTTVTELGFPNVNVISAYSSIFWQYSKEAAEVHMVGGPLMHIEELGIILLAFHRAKVNGNKTKIFGCGIGPLDAGPEYREAVIRILKLTDEIGLRDDNSVRWAEKSTGRKDCYNIGDPASSYVQRWKSGYRGRRSCSYLNLYLREWPDQYKGEYSRNQFSEVRRQFEDKLGEWVNVICQEHSLRPRLIPMHHFYAGNDDRHFNRRFAAANLATQDAIVEEHPLTLDQILETMLLGKYSICMRYHSVVFAQTLYVPFIAIDYSLGGKIQNFLSENENLHRMISPSDVALGKRLLFY